MINLIENLKAGKILSNRYTDTIHYYKLDKDNMVMAITFNTYKVLEELGKSNLDHHTYLTSEFNNNSITGHYKLDKFLMNLSNIVYQVVDDTKVIKETIGTSFEHDEQLLDYDSLKDRIDNLYIDYNIKSYVLYSGLHSDDIIAQKDLIKDTKEFSHLFEDDKKILNNYIKSYDSLYYGTGMLYYFNVVGFYLTTRNNINVVYVRELYHVSNLLSDLIKNNNTSINVFNKHITYKVKKDSVNYIFNYINNTAKEDLNLDNYDLKKINIDNIINNL